MMLELRAPIMFVGPAGTGKTQLVKGKLAGAYTRPLFGSS
jgi:dynein heavy chain